MGATDIVEQQCRRGIGTVAVASYDDALVGVDIRTGDEVWLATLDEFRSETDPFATASGTVGQAGDRVFFGTADRLGGLQASLRVR